MTHLQELTPRVQKLTENQNTFQKPVFSSQQIVFSICKKQFYDMHLTMQNLLDDRI